MGSRYEAEITITSAKDLKNVNWRNGPIKPYAVVWIDPKSKCSSRVDEEGDVFPYWDQTLVIPFNSPIEEAVLYIDIVHAKKTEEDSKPLIGSARLPLREVVDEVGLGRKGEKKLVLKRPSGRPHGKLEVKVNVRQPSYRAPDPYQASPYGVARDRDYPAPSPAYGAPYGAPPANAYGAPPANAYGAPPASAYGAPPASAYGAPPANAYGAPPASAYGAPPASAYGAPPASAYGAPPASAYGAPPASAYGSAPPPAGYPYGGQAPQPAYGQPPPTSYGQSSYVQSPSSYGSSQGYVEGKKKNKFGGMGTGLAVGAVAGVLGGLALAEGAEYVEDKIADDVAEKVEADYGYDDAGDW